ncbi:hypothetical protein [Tranquillimonas rosea]|nr:hypothetical protein [Tranquillimonas rosea]
MNAGHIFGLALLIGAVVPMDLRCLRRHGHPDPVATVRLLRPVAASGFVLAATCGALLFATQATDYVDNTFFRIKIVLIAVAVLNAALHPGLARLPMARRRMVALLSLALWPAALICGRLIAYS